MSIEQTDLGTLRSLVAGGSPVLLALALAGNQGSHFVVATGVAADGSVLISDPDPSFGQTNLNGYLNGLATLAGAVRLLPQAPAFPERFFGGIECSGAGFVGCGDVRNRRSHFRPSPRPHH